MANFNENVNRVIGYILNSKEFRIYKAGTIKEFARMIYDDLYLLTNTYRLFIQYKTTHRAQKLAGHCFLWDNSHGDHMADPGNGIELRSINDASQDDCEGFCRPRFDDMESAILITDRCVFMYGDVQIEAYAITQDKKTRSLRCVFVRIRSFMFQNPGGSVRPSFRSEGEFSGAIRKCLRKDRRREASPRGKRSRRESKTKRRIVQEFTIFNQADDRASR